MNIERLLRLADLLDKTSPKNFNMSTFGTTDHFCGTVTCALGTAGFDPWFNEQGFYNKIMFHRYISPRYKNYYCFGAASHFFEISNSIAERLFNPFDGNETPTEVATNIRHLVETGALHELFCA